MDTPSINNEYSFTKPRRQLFSLPYGFTNHIFKNYKAELYLKLAMSCKQFYAQKRLIVADRITVFYNGSRVYFNNIANAISLNAMKNNHSKFWITEKIGIKSIFLILSLAMIIGFIIYF